MDLYAGLDVSMATTAVCVMDTDGEIVAEFSVPSNAGELGMALTPYRDRLVLVGLEAGPMSEWIMKGLLDQGFEIIQIETRQVNAALSALMVKTGRNHARGIAKLLWLEWFRPVCAKRRQRGNGDCCSQHGKASRTASSTSITAFVACCAALACGHRVTYVAVGTQRSRS